MIRGGPQLTAPGERAKQRHLVHGTCIPSRVSSPGTDLLSLRQGTACALEGQVSAPSLCQAKEFVLPQQQSQAGLCLGGAGTGRIEQVLDSDFPLPPCHGPQARANRAVLLPPGIVGNPSRFSSPTPHPGQQSSILIPFPHR